MSDYWKDNNIEKPQQYIVCAAVKFDGNIVCGPRHHDKVMRDVIFKMVEKYPANADDGFVDQFGEFLTREEAMIVAKASGQPLDIEKGCGGDQFLLYSEGLY